MPRRYRVTLYNQHANCGIYAEGRTRREAFEAALVRAGEPFIREGGDKLSMFRHLFFEHLMHAHYRTAPHCYASDPIGAGVEFRRLDIQRVITPAEKRRALITVNPS